MAREGTGVVLARDMAVARVGMARDRTMAGVSVARDMAVAGVDMFRDCSSQFRTYTAVGVESVNDHVGWVTWIL